MIRSLRDATRYAIQIAVRPGRTTRELLGDPARLGHAVTAWLLISALYGLVAWIGGLNGFGPTVAPWVRAPVDTYYLWMGPLTPAIYLLHFLVLAGLVQLMSRLVDGAGTFEDTFAVACLTFCGPVFATMWIWEMPVLVFLPDLRSQEMGGLGYLPGWLDLGRQIVGVVSILVLLVAAVARVQKLSVTLSSAITLLAALPAWIAMLTYLR